MNGGNSVLVNMARARRGAAILALLLCLVMLAGCNSMNEAEKKVSGDLGDLKASDYISSEITDLRASLTEEGKENFDGFIDKLKDFDFEITDSQTDNNQNGEYTLVNVRIKTYDFGKEYLAAWTEYLKSNQNPGDDLTDFYEILFLRLNALGDKDMVSSISIRCVDPLGNGEWIADIKDNEELQDAISGGMMSEMKSLAAE